ncbi:DNA topoisomerase I [Candidatus Amesbacteria bacterium RIFOXYB1_FULL_44_23]|uniref:DNA topoisomerase 1 n=1 Tax=Candidatus Amesbacteria bacterium RIFOXYB1_FULL_44_23 TaxID=1797263 RepID=A0A1F4ZSV3_9BACT|nr:MAG: DNA topoisomerase I [Candidatus Amesbacteria bacterium RIFOXYB1_FULL_44_23]
MNLIIVESPTKARTLARFLGAGFEIRASYGHVRDLPQRKMGVKIISPKAKDSDGSGEYKFVPEYVMVDKQKERVDEIKKLSEQAEKVYLATDPDREGEAIAWHVGQVLDVKGLTRRIEFHEITEKAIKLALEDPREIDTKLVDAQQARRILDRLVGYKLSPLLWRKIRKGLSAGRVQSVAVRLIVDREREIEAFKPEEYWNISVLVKDGQNSKFAVTLVEKNGEKIKVVNGDQAHQVEEDLRQAMYEVEKVEEKEIKKSPPAPFTTSSLQQTAANKLGWTAKRTMQVAQMLYEEGYITYHRTDSTNVATEAAEGVAVFITNGFGKEYALDKPRFYKTKSKVAQEAHEAIRPTDFSSQHTEHSAQLNRDQARLYELIWKRFVGCQMAEATGVSVKVSVSGKTSGASYGLEAKGETIKFDGWLKLYETGGRKVQAATEELDEKENEVLTLPEIKTGEKLEFVDFSGEQKFTQPPARYNDASLIKALEERGIGRPSTYAPILTTIQERQYVERLEKRLKPTSLGIAVSDFLVANFTGIVDYGFTARMEDELDEIANGDRLWQPTISEFYGPFEAELLKVSETAQRVKVEVEITGDKCPTCGQGDVVVRIGKFGKFLACSRYPECTYKANWQEKIGVACPKCGGDVIMRKTKSHKNFYGCSNYPNCDFASWTKPKAEATETGGKNE